MAIYRIEMARELQPALSQEWLLTNGAGAFSSSSVVGCNTRRYHSLLCAAVNPPLGRVVTLSRIAEQLVFPRSETLEELSVNQFAGNIHPRGDRYLLTFDLDDLATWTYEVNGATVRKELLLLMKRNAVALRYHIDPGKHEKVDCRFIPFFALRDFHSLRRQDQGAITVQSQPGRLRVSEGNLSVTFQADNGEFIAATEWWRDHEYAIDAERGQDFREDLMSPGRFMLDVFKPTTITFLASVEPLDDFDWDAEVKKRHAAFATTEGASPIVSQLIRAAEDFIVDRRCPDGSMGKTVIAGYPWFSDWGRDTMISLPGLFLTTGRVTEAGGVLKLFAEYVSQGMIPNRFDDYTNEPTYNTVDASLWFIHACFEFHAAGGDAKLFEQTLLPACRAIVQGYREGTRYFIHMDEADGLISQGDPTTQLTWMDAKCGDIAFTPRQGKAVEINALWYHALCLLKETALAEKVRKSFVSAFWISAERGLRDIATGEFSEQIRPNQIFAASLPNTPLDREQQRAVVNVVREQLLTPFGLRTLASSDPQFSAVYLGTQFIRDAAYHNGTVWAWLLGAFLDAHLRVNDNSPAAVQQARLWLAPLIDTMRHLGCIGQIGEIYEATPPYRPVGCCAQAWSVAETLRLATKLKM